MTAATRILLIRHGHTDAVGTRLVSRTPGVHLSAQGRREIAIVRDRLARTPLAAIYASPIERTMETATLIASAHGLTVQPLDGAIEVEFGAWTGLTFEELERRPDWRLFNAERDRADVPGGERAAAVQARIVAALEDLRRTHPSATIAVVSHGDVIRNAVLHVAGVPIREWHRVEISPASITVVEMWPGGARLLTVNERPASAPGAWRQT